MYIGYPYGASIWIDGIFYGYAPCFVPRIVVGWHHVRIWYNDFYWYDGRFSVCSGCWFDYACDDIRYKDSYKHYGFKPKRRGSADVVAKKYHPDRRRSVYTREAGYVSKNTYEEKYARKSTRRGVASSITSGKSEWSKQRTHSGKRTGVKIDDRSIGKDSKRKTTSWDDYNRPKVKSSADKSRSKSKKSKSYKIKGSSTKQKSPGYSKPKSGGTKKSPGYSKPKGSGTKKSPGYSKPKGGGSKGRSSSFKGSKSTPKPPSGGSNKSSGSGGKKGPKRR
jgi:hypothetical protein